MLKTNSKQAKENIKKYIIKGFNYCDNPEIQEGATFGEVARFIYKRFRAEKFSCLEDYNYYHFNEGAAFTAWAQGLASVFDFCYYYNRPALDDLGDILEESETERARFTEQQAETMLTYLIYTTIKKEIEKQEAQR